MPERLILGGFQPFVGKHCETTALKRVLDYHSLSLSEEMLFGLGGGVGFNYWYTKNMPSPFIGTRNGKVAHLLINICRRIGAHAAVFETSSPRRGYEELKGLLRSNEPAIIYCDMVYLPYLALPEMAHFGGHAIVVFGLDEERNEVYIYDRGRYPVKAKIADLAKARGSRFSPFPPRQRLLNVKCPARIGNLQEDIKESIQECCQNMLKPPIKNIGLAGMRKWSSLVTEWPQQFEGVNLLGALMNAFIYIAVAGTGGSAFRSMYAMFLEEASYILNNPALREVAETMLESAKVWSEIASRLLPDSWPSLKRIRELILEKNRIFEEQEPGALAAMVKINAQLEELTGRAVKDLVNCAAFLAHVQESISRCHKIETGAFQRLSASIC